MRPTVSRRAERCILLAVVVGLLAGLLSLLYLNMKPVSAGAPSGFTDQLVASVLKRPTALAFTPDGRLLVANQNGKLLVYENGALRTTPALDISAKICSAVGERGLAGIAVDPNFAANHYIYLYYTFKKHGVCEQNTANVPVNRVERYVLSNRNVATPNKILVDNIPHMYVHNGGDLHFGKDGYLYITVGDGGCDYAGDSGCFGQNDASRDPHTLLGKVLRITRDGGIPPTNPYQGADSARCNLTGMTSQDKNCQETFASGLRNPFRFAFDPNASDTRFFINDVGEAQWEEVDLGKKGADYAWNLCEGNHDNPNMPGSVNCAAPYTPPIHEYGHATGCSAITGAAFVPDGVWPAAYDGFYLYSDYVCGKIFALKPDGAGGFTRTEFVTGLGTKSAVAMTFGPYGSGKALYYTTFGNEGEVRRIVYTGRANRSPTATVAANSTSGPSPLAVDFDASGSSDPDIDDTLTNYLWDFGDDSPTQTTTTPTTTHTYSTEGTYTASLRVEDNHGAVSDPDTVRIDAGNEAPIPAIGSPPADLLYRVDQRITLSGSATDPEDGRLPEDSLEWEVLKHHNGSHSHLVFEGTGNNLTFATPPPEGLFSAGAGNYLEVRLTATDSSGLSKTVTQEVQPNRVDVSLATNPSGLSLVINGETFTTPKTLLSWEGYTLGVNAPSPQSLSGKSYVFDSWSDAKGQQHDIITGAAPSSYTATFKICTKSGTLAAETLSGTSGADVICAMGGNDTIDGRGGDDVLLGGGGADKVKGSAGSDSLYGENGNDALNSRDGMSGNDSLDGGAGTDTRTTDPTEKSIVNFP